MLTVGGEAITPKVQKTPAPPAPRGIVFLSVCLSDGKVILSWEVSSHDKRSLRQEDKLSEKGVVDIFEIHLASTACCVIFFDPPNLLSLLKVPCILSVKTPPI